MQVGSGIRFSLEFVGKLMLLLLFFFMFDSFSGLFY